MTNEKLTVEEIDAAIEELNKAKKEKLEASKVADLELVKKLCKQHGFTATNLRGALATKGKKKAVGDVVEKKPAAKKTAAKKAPKAR